MSNELLLRRLGLLIVDGFVDDQLCHAGIAAARCGPAKEAGVLVNGEAVGVSETVRKTLKVKVSDDLRERITEDLHRFRPTLEEYFGVELGRIEGPDFLRYERGHLFRPHTDQGSLERSGSRSVSVVILLNGPGGEGSPTFDGGALLFHDLFPPSEGVAVGIPVPLVRGRLVAFRSTVVHEVQEVLAGERFSVVAWYHSRAA